MNALKHLNALLASLPTGDIKDQYAVENALADAWKDLRCTGPDGGMTASKISGRLEKVSWASPILSFQVERHGGTMNGSTRAEMQHWEIDVEKATRAFVRSGRRQLYPTAKRWDHRGLAKTLAACVRAGQDHAGLRWTKAGKIGINRNVIPVAVAQTMAARVKRLKKAIGDELGDHDWREKVWRK